MAYDKVVDSAALDAALTDVADAIREKGGTADTMTLEEMPGKIAEIQAGGGATEPYVEETYDSVGNLIAAKLVGHTKVRNSACYNCNSLALTELPAGITSIGNSAFYYCNSLASLTFKDTPNSIASSAFRSCYNLATINVPWAEGAVASAPWGATNATINYNYTGG